MVTPPLKEIVARALAGGALFDVREAGEINQGHIPGASALPRRMIELQIAQLVQRRDTPVTIYDEGGGRAALAAATLKELGYTNVAVLEGGTAAWTAAGGALVEGKNVPSKTFAEEMFEHERLPQITAEALEEKRKTGAPFVLCDIRAPEEHAIGHVPGAHNVPGVELAAVAADLAGRNVPVVVHCAGRTRSILACQTLRALGVKDAYALKNGTMGWTLAGYTLEREPGAPLPPTEQSVRAGTQASRRLAEKEGAKAISAADTLALLADVRAGKANGYVFDVRQADAYAARHLKDTVWLPGGQAFLFADENIAVRSAPIVCVDDGGPQAWMTAYWFRRLGYPDVRVLEGGLAAVADPALMETGRHKPKPLQLDEARKAVPRVDAAQAQRLLASEPGATVVDVNTSKNYTRGHLAGAVWIPRGWLELWSTDGSVKLGSPLLVVCQNGLQSGYAGRTLAKLGHPRVMVLDGGLEAWKKAGLPLEEGKPQGRTVDVVKNPYERTKEDMVKYLDWEQKLAQKAP